MYVITKLVARLDAYRVHLPGAEFVKHDCEWLSKDLEAYRALQLHGDLFQKVVVEPTATRHWTGRHRSHLKIHVRMRISVP